MTVLEALKKAREILSNKKNWIQGTMADDRRYSVSPISMKAKRWCATGALAKVIGSNDNQQFSNARTALSQAVNGDNPESVNDDQGYTAMLAMYDAAIKTGEACRRKELRAAKKKAS